MDTMIFTVGVCVSLLLAGGLTFTVLEFNRLERRGPQEKDDARLPL